MLGFWVLTCAVGVASGELVFADAIKKVRVHSRDYAYWPAFGAAIEWPSPAARIVADGSAGCCLEVPALDGSLVAVRVQEMPGFPVVAGPPGTPSSPQWLATIVDAKLDARQRLETERFLAIGQALVSAARDAGLECVGVDLADQPSGLSAEIVARATTAGRAPRAPYVAYTLVPLRQTLLVASVSGLSGDPQESLRLFRRIHLFGMEGGRRAAERIWSDLEGSRGAAGSKWQASYPSTAETPFAASGDRLVAPFLDLSVLSPESRERWEARIQHEKDRLSASSRQRAEQVSNSLEQLAEINNAAAAKRPRGLAEISKRLADEPPGSVEVTPERSISERLQSRGITVSSYGAAPDNFELLLSVPMLDGPLRVTPDGVFGPAGQATFDAPRSSR